MDFFNKLHIFVKLLYNFIYMKEVTKDIFYSNIGPQDACIRIENEYKWPYIQLFELRHSRKLVGKIVDSYTDGIEHNYPIITKYFVLSENN